jgi:hypothetical protein
VTGQVGGGFNDPRNGGARRHSAGDIYASPGDPVFAPGNMEVVAGGRGGTNLRNNDYWLHARDVDTGHIYKFAHTGDITHLKPGTVIPAGEHFAEVGGVVDKPHLHMGVVDPDGKHVDWLNSFRLRRDNSIRSGKRGTEYAYGEAVKKAEKVAGPAGLKPYDSDVIPLESSNAGELKPYDGGVVPLTASTILETKRLGPSVMDGTDTRGWVEKARDSIVQALSPGTYAGVDKGMYDFFKRNPNATEEQINAVYTDLTAKSAAEQVTLMDDYATLARSFANSIITPVQGVVKAVLSPFTKVGEALETVRRNAGLDPKYGPGLYGTEEEGMTPPKQGLIDSLLHPENEKHYGGKWFPERVGGALGTLVPYAAAGKVAQAGGMVLTPGSSILEKLIFNTATFLPVDVARAFQESGSQGVTTALWHSPITAALFTVGGLPKGRVGGTVGTGLAGAGSAAAGGERDPAKLMESFATLAILHNVMGTRPEKAKEEVEKFISDNGLSQADVDLLRSRVADVDSVIKYVEGQSYPSTVVQGEVTVGKGKKARTVAGPVEAFPEETKLTPASTDIITKADRREKEAEIKKAPVQWSREKGRWLDQEQQKEEGAREVEKPAGVDTMAMYGGGPDTKDWFSGVLEKSRKTTSRPVVGPVAPVRSLDDARAIIDSKISTGEHAETKRHTLSDIYTHMVDRLNPVSQLVATSRPERISDDPYKLARLYNGWHGKADAFIDYHPFDRSTMQFKTDIEPLRAILKPLENTGQVNDFSRYLIAKRSIERTGRGFETGVNQEAAGRVVKELGPTMAPHAEKFYSYMDSLLQYMKDGGLISEERYQKIKDGSTDYAPMMRLLNMEITQGSGKGFEASQIVKAFKGSERDIIDPLESAVKLTYSMVNAAERNIVGASLVGWAKQSGEFGKSVIPVEYYPAGKGWLKSKVAEKKLKEYGFTSDEAAIFMPSNFRPDNNTISVWNDGKREYFKVAPEIADIVKGADQESIHILTKVLAFPAQMLRLGATTLSPEFGIRNFLKDQFPGFIHSKYGYTPFIDFFKGLVTMAERGEKYWQYMISGAPHASLVSMDRKMLQQKLTDVLAGKERIPGFLVKHPIEAMKILSEYSEIGTRMGEFLKGVKKEGATAEGIQQAGLASRELTVDFGRIGSSSRTLNMLTAFWNANIQGLDRVVRAHKERPLMTMAKSAMAVTLPAIMLEMIYHDDERYQNLPQWRKDLFYNIPTDIGVISLPKPWTYGLLYGAIPQRIVNQVMTDSPHAYDGLLQAFGREMPDFPIPTAIKPFIEAWSNKNLYTDRPLISQRKINLPPKYQYGTFTSETSQELGNMISKLPVIGDTAAASPTVLDHFVKSWTGGFGKMALDAVDFGLEKSGAVKTVPKPTKAWSDVSIVKAFIARYPAADAEPIKAFYENMKSIDAKALAIKDVGGTLALQGKKEELGKLIKEFGPEAIIQLDSARKSVNNAMKFIDLVHKHPDMTPDQKREAIDKTYTSVIGFTKKINTALDTVRLKQRERR